MSARTLALSAIFIGPTAALIDLSASFFLVLPAQESGSKAWLHVLTVVAALLTAFGIVLARRALSRDRPPGAEVDRFLALSGVALNAFFLLVIVGFAIPKLVHGVTD